LRPDVERLESLETGVEPVSPMALSLSLSLSLPLSLSLSLSLS
jgi:hypothetical protein